MPSQPCIINSSWTPHCNSPVEFLIKDGCSDEKHLLISYNGRRTKCDRSGTIIIPRMIENDISIFPGSCQTGGRPPVQVTDFVSRWKTKSVTCTRIGFRDPFACGFTLPLDPFDLIESKSSAIQLQSEFEARPLLRPSSE